MSRYLTPTTPQEAVQDYLTEREGEDSKSTVDEKASRLNRFLDWCDQVGFQQMNKMSGRAANDYKKWRKEQVAATTLEFEMGTFRQFLKHCERIEACREGVAGKVKIPRVSKKDRSRSVKLDPESAKEIQQYLRKYEYCSLRHVLFATFWETGVRSSTLKAFDVRDFDPHNEHGPVLKARHRPESGTPLKKDEYSERNISISGKLTALLQEWVDNQRPDVTDDHGRHPLFATKNGRVYKTTLQRNIYTATRPCHVGEPCPHNRDPDECEATTYNTASKCPTSVSPHALRRSTATLHRAKGHDRTTVGMKLDMSEETLENHYEETDFEQERANRKGLLDDFDDFYGDDAEDP